MSPEADRSYEFGPFLLNAAERVLLCQGQRVPLPPKVFETLLILVENAGHVVPKETLFKRVWPDTIVQEDSLTFNISNLRKTLGHYGGGQHFIQTEPKLGYRFVAPVKVQESGARSQESGARNQVTGVRYQVSGAALGNEGRSLRRRMVWVV